MTRTPITLLAAVAALAISAGTASARTSPKPHAAHLTIVLNNTMVSGFAARKRVNGIIMRDGGVCDPIRHMGC